ILHVAQAVMNPVIPAIFREQTVYFPFHFPIRSIRVKSTKNALSPRGNDGSAAGDFEFYQMMTVLIHYRVKMSFFTKWSIQHRTSLVHVRILIPLRIEVNLIWQYRTHPLDKSFHLHNGILRLFFLLLLKGVHRSHFLLSLLP